MKNIKPVTGPYKMPIAYYGNQVVQEVFEGKFTFNEILNYAQKRSDGMKKAKFDGQIAVQLLYPSVNRWRSGYFTPVGDPVHLWSPDDYEDGNQNEYRNATDFSEFTIIYMKNPPRAGGCKNKYNDCLYNALTLGLGEHQKMDHPRKLKKFLGLERCAKVPIDLMHKIDESLDTFKINVSGDHTYTSTKTCPRTINLKLLDGHYSLVSNKIKVQGVAYKEKIPLMYNKLQEDGYNVYDPTDGSRVMEKITFDHHKENPQSSKYIIIPVNENFKGTIEEQYAEWTTEADILKQETDGLINLYKTGKNMQAAKSLFNHFNRSIVAQVLLQVEAEWLNNASFAALIYAVEYNGPAYKYDICSHYPSLMKHQLMFFPIKAGTFKKLTDAEFHKLDRLPYGIYRCKIEKSDKVAKHFRYNPLNYYTHIDLGTAKELNLQITMIVDNQPNQLMYNRSDMVTGSQLFKEYFEYMFKLKDKKIPRAKDIINILWGALSQKNLIKMVVNNDSTEVTDIGKDRTILEICPRNKKQTTVTFYKNDSMYETPYARIAPFVLARGRQLIRKFMMKGDPTLENVKFIHTDGWISSQKLDIETGTKMGDTKYEGYCADCFIKNPVNKSKSECFKV